jgi:hypothetical protein
MMGGMTCRVCSKDRELSRVGICRECHGELGIVLPAAPLRPPVPCARCRGTSFVRSWALREVETRLGSALNEPAVGTFFAPLSLALTPGTRSSVFGASAASSEDSLRLGIIEAYACRQCGFTELYTHEAAAIPIGPEFGTELVDLPPPEGPFR